MCVRDSEDLGRLKKQDVYFCMIQVVVFLATGVNFINKLLELFAPIFCAKKLESQNVTSEKLHKALSSKN